MPSRLTLLARALTLRCPNCGHRGLFRHWFAMRDFCPTCGLSLTISNSVGANLLNLVAAECLLMIALASVIILSWPTPPWTLLQYGAPLMMVVTPLLLYPTSKVVFVAFDLALHPAARPDIRVHGIGDTPS
ncbi:MAG: DUF983 domain-containing protein [Gemmatimonadota bacterium]